MIDITETKKLWPETCHGRWMDPEYEQGLVSVIIPTYNRAHFITDAMDSVWKQTYRPIELIVVDDGSTDNTSEVVEKWGKKTEDNAQFELRYYRQENKGAPAARNLGCIKSRGEFIQFLDSDDLLSSSKLTRQTEVYRTRNIGFATVYGHSCYFRKKGDRYSICKRRHFREDGNQLCSWLCGPSILPICPLWKRRNVMKIGPWDESLLGDQDGDFGMRFILLGGQYISTKEVCAYYRDHLESRVGKNRNPEAGWSRVKVAEKIERILRKRGCLSGELRLALAKRYFSLGYVYCLNDISISDYCSEKSRQLAPLHYMPVNNRRTVLIRLLGIRWASKLRFIIRDVLQLRIGGGNPQTDEASSLQTLMT